MKRILTNILLCALAATSAGAQVNYRLDAGVSTYQSHAGLIVMGGGANNYQLLYTKNLLSSMNPSLRGVNQQFVLTAAGGSATTATSNQQYANEPVNYYAGMKLVVACGGYSNTSGTNGQCNGAEQGQTVTVTSSTVPVAPAALTASISGNVLTVSAVTGTLVPGAALAGNPTLPSPFLQIVSQTDGAAGGTGHYTLSGSATVASQSMTTNALGAVLTFPALSGGAAIQLNDTLLLYAPETGFNSVWQTKYNYANDATHWTMETTLADQPAASVTGLPAPDQTLTVALASASDVASLQTNIDNGSQGNQYAFSGNYAGAIDVNVLGGATGCTVTMQAFRQLGTGNVYFINQTQAIGGSGWQTINFASSAPATETNLSPTAQVVVQYIFGGCAASILMQNVALNSTAPQTNVSPLTDAAIQLIKNMGVSGVRFNGTNGANGGTFGCSTVQLLQKASQRLGCNPIMNYPTQVNTGFSYDDEVKICQAVGGDTCALDISPTATDADLQCLNDYLAAAVGVGTACNGVSGGSIRAFYGQTAPWTTVFAHLPLELSNEAWNTAFIGSSWNYTQGSILGASVSNYFAQVIHVCSVLKASSSWNSAVEQCAANAQENSNPSFTPFLNGSAIDLVASSGYHQDGSAGVTNCDAGTFFDDGWADAYNNTVNSGSLQYSVAHSGHKVFTYEAGQGFYGGVCATGSTPVDIATNVGYSLVDPLMAAYLHATYNGVFPYWSNFVFQQQTRPFNSTASTNPTTLAYGWGHYAGTGGSFVFPRPEVYAEALFNACEALGQINLPVTTGQITSNHSLSNGVPAQTGVPLMPGFVYRNGNQRCLVVANGDRTGGAHPFTVSGADAPASGTTVTKTLYASGNTFNQDNETQTGTAVVGPNVVSTLSGFTGDTLSPAQAASYVWQVGTVVLRQLF